MLAESAFNIAKSPQVVATKEESTIKEIIEKETKCDSLPEPLGTLVKCKSIQIYHQ